VTSWSFLTNHARVLLCIARDPGMRLRDLAASLGITERSAHRLNPYYLTRVITSTWPVAGVLRRGCRRTSASSRIRSRLAASGMLLHA
jgi:hypothetical protein